MFSRIAPRLFAVPTEGGQNNPFLAGPDREADLRSRRPYFLIPLLGPRHAQLTHGAVARVRAWVRRQGKPITDVFVLSHGWHRNFFSAVAAYDRLMVGFRRLIGRGAIEPSPDFNPLFLTVHWHSDPGENLWLDKEGRRSKVGFMANVCSTFRAADPAATSEATLERDFELMFDLLSSLSAPDTDASGPEFDEEARGLAEVLDRRYVLRADPAAGTDDKVAALWVCYYEAPSRRVLMLQERKPRPFATGFQGLSRLLAFITSAVPAVTLMGLIVNLPVPRLRVTDAHYVIGAAKPIMTTRRATMRDAVGMGWMWFGRRTLDAARATLAVTGSLHAVRSSTLTHRLHRIRVHVAAMVGLAAVSGLLLWLIGLWRSLFAPQRPATAIPWLALLPWLYLQALFALPLIAYSLAGLILSFAWLGPIGQALRLVSDERQGLRDRPDRRAPTLSVAAAFAWLARRPVRWLKSAVALDSRWTNLGDLAEAQLAFYDMQQRGVMTGVYLGEALEDLWRGTPELERARLHLAGHSFGSLVVANAARTLAFASGFRGQLRTLTLIQGALASGWLSGERRLLDRITGAVACIFSRYDSANGFWYPLANLGREAAGHVGLCGDFATVANCMPPSLVVPPQLGPIDPNTKVINVDASRIIYSGAVAAGGGHGDIFKDDVLHVLWAAMQA